MKKILAFTLFVLMGVVISFSQDINFHAKAGVGFANFTGDANGDPLFSYKVGVGMNIGLGGHWELHPDLFFVRKGTTSSIGENIEGTLFTLKQTINANYLELPIMAAYRISLPSTNVVLNAGPYLAYGLNGKYKFEAGEEKTKINTFGKDALKRFDCGLGVGVAFEFGKFIAGIDANFGLANIAPSGKDNDQPNMEVADVEFDKDSKIHNIAAHITIGYKF
ncbi:MULTISPECIES: porin family protein [Mediterranea]|uniref:porin family protein n=1 Tax=Mediterranea TaxID=1926659 RepID=UPI0020120C2E|nr:MULTISPECIES: porin family protein [Mediterranea]MCL1608397.1 PorT family protein [Mediterranea sp. ET5]MDM8123118.1 porin family protein [Mediterranea massiliensis]MDM8199285.1 porin family protein [Mediterranea massiliensis]